VTEKRDASPLRRLADATHHRLRNGESPENWAATRDAIADHLRSYVAGAVEKIEPEVVLLLLSSLEQATAKELPSLFTPLAKVRGESPNTAGVQACLKTAAEYVAFCNEHADKPWIDRAPVTTVSKAYETSIRTVQRWKVYASAAPQDGWGLEPEERFQVLSEGMKASAVLYRKFGGATSAAIRSRARGKG
jgi:hypothetical protein